MSAPKHPTGGSLLAFLVTISTAMMYFVVLKHCTDRDGFFMAFGLIAANVVHSACKL